jgi:hypothetical protein
MARKLSLDDRDNLSQVVGMPGWSALLAHLDGMVAEEYRRFDTMDLGTVTDRQLLIKMAQAEGSRRLVAGLKQWAKNLKAKQDS